MADINQVAQDPSPGQLITLYELDLAPLGDATVMRFTPDHLVNGNDIVFRGYAYDHVDVAAKGFEITGNGPIPTPSIQVANVGALLSGLLLQYEDLVGAMVRRIRTFSSFLDGGPDAAEANYAFAADVYVVENKQAHTKTHVEWKLSSVLDQQGRKLPGRQVLRDTCLHRYRFYNPTTTSFEYTNATCPYSGTNYWTAQGDVTTAANDRCGKRLSDCKLRFGTTGVLPTRAFPGAARFRRN